MARTKEEDLMITRKVNTLLNEGFEVKQAQAIAFRMYRDGELTRYKPKRRRKGYNQRKVNQVKKVIGALITGKKRK